MKKPAVLGRSGLSIRLLSFVSPQVILPLLVVLLIGILLIHGWKYAQADSLGDDASENLRYALNFAQHGVYAGEVGELLPDYRREPLPNWILAGHLKWLLGIKSGVDFRDLIGNPERLASVVRVNLFYLLALFSSLWALCLLLLRPRWLAHLAAMVVIYLSATEFVYYELDNLNTELIASCLFVLAGASFVLVRRRPHVLLALFAGLIFGGLVLTKASGSYLALLILPVLPLLWLGRSRQAINLGLCVALGFALAVLPWVVRNLIDCGDAAVARGGGKVLLFRSSYNQMTAKEFLGAFYAYAPDRLKKDVFEPVLGFSESQLECGGSLQRLSRNLPCDEQAIAEGRFKDVQGFYKSVQPGLLTELSQQAARQKPPKPEEDYFKEVAVSRIRAQPWKHLLVSLPLAWRGSWSFDSKKTWAGVITNAFAFASLLLMPWLGLWLRRADWTLMSIMGVGYFLFYALLSHFIVRYSKPLIPLALVCLSVLLVEAARMMLSRWQSHR